MRKSLTSCCLVLVAGLMLLSSPLLSAPARAQNPAQSNAGGRSLGDWLESYWTWTLGGGEAKAGRVKNTVFLPLPAAAPSEEDESVLEGELPVTLRPGERFVLPLFAYIGERYLEAGLEDDDPADLPDGVVSDARVLLKLDGKTLIDSEADDMSELFVETRYFPQPVVYPEPHENAPGVHAVAALWFQGFGVVQPPLSKGEHTLELFVYSDVLHFGYHNTWHVTVGR